MHYNYNSYCARICIMYTILYVLGLCYSQDDSCGYTESQDAHPTQFRGNEHFMFFAMETLKVYVTWRQCSNKEAVEMWRRLF